MGEYADVKTRKVRKFIKWLKRNKSIEVRESGKHLVVTCIYNGKSFPVPVAHRVVNKNILKEFMNKLIEWRICTETEIRDRL